MQYTIPDYYKEFTCIADKCEDTCCAGWKIVIDKKSLNKYKHVKGKFWFTMLKSVDWIRGIFRQDKEKRCAFLNDCNLCEMYANLGEKSLCKTCRLYPRHVEKFEDVREITLSVSCPEVARILMEKKEPVRFLTYEKEGGIIELVYIVLQSVVKPGITGFFKIDLHIKCYIYLS